MGVCARWTELRRLRTNTELPSSRTRPKPWEPHSGEGGQVHLDCLAVSVSIRLSPWEGWEMAGQLRQTILKSLALQPSFDSTVKTDRLGNSIIPVTPHCWTTFRLPFWM